jgi:hypothetical protein
MMRVIIAALLIINLTGCASLFGWDREKSITVNTKAQPRTPLNLADPPPIKPHVPQWIVITPDNAEDVWKNLKSKNIDLVLFGLTDDGYESLSVDTAQVRNFIYQQRELLNRYRNYYEPKPPEEPKPAK